MFGLFSPLSQLKGVRISLFYVLYTACMCVCVFICTFGDCACEWRYVCVHGSFGGEKATSGVSQSSPFTLFKSESLFFFSTMCLRLAGWGPHHEPCPFLTSHHDSTRLTRPLSPSFMWAIGTQSWVLALAWPAFPLMSHFSSILYLFWLLEVGDRVYLGMKRMVESLVYLQGTTWQPRGIREKQCFTET